MARSEETIVKTKWLLLATVVWPLMTLATGVRFLGFSTAPVSAHEGFAGLHSACQETFGARARICFADEVVRAPEIVRFTEDLQAWVQPGANRFPCAGWTSSLGSSTVLDARSMAFVNRSCGALLPVTCCQ